MPNSSCSFQALNYDAKKTYAWILRDVRVHPEPFEVHARVHLEIQAKLSAQVPTWAAHGSVVWLRREHCLNLARRGTGEARTSDDGPTASLCKTTSDRCNENRSSLHGYVCVRCRVSSMLLDTSVPVRVLPKHTQTGRTVSDRLERLLSQRWEHISSQPCTRRSLPALSQRCMG